MIKFSVIILLDQISYSIFQSKFFNCYVSVSKIFRNELLWTKFSIVWNQKFFSPNFLLKNLKWNINFSFQLIMFSVIILSDLIFYSIFQPKFFQCYVSVSKIFGNELFRSNFSIVWSQKFFSQKAFCKKVLNYVKIIFYKLTIRNPTPLFFQRNTSLVLLVLMI